MKQTIKISRANFPGMGNFSWLQFFIDILQKKYEVTIDAENPDIVIYTNQFYQAGTPDYLTGATVRGVDEYPDHVKKVFISGEARPDFTAHLSKGSNYYCLGYEHLEHSNYLRFPTYVLDVHVLYKEGGLFESPFNWLTAPRDAERTIKEKQHYCSIVQASNNPDRAKLFDLISQDHWIKSAGPWRQTISDAEALNPYKYHNYSNPNYLGRIDGLTYRDKVNFFRDCYFNIAFQWTNTPYLTQEKLVHAFAADTIPVFYGNEYILEEGFNPAAFINAHDYSSFEELVESMKEVYISKDKLRNYYSEPFFTGNKLPIYFEEDYILNFFEKIIQD